SSPPTARRPRPTAPRSTAPSPWHGRRSTSRATPPCASGCWPARAAERSVPAEHEEVVELAVVPRRTADQHVGGDAAERVDHRAVDETREPDVVRLDGRPPGHRLRRDLPVVDRSAVRRLVVHDEIARPREPAELLVVVSPERPGLGARPAEPLLEVGE